MKSGAKMAMMMIYGDNGKDSLLVDWAVIICTAATGRMIYQVMMMTNDGASGFD